MNRKEDHSMATNSEYLYETAQICLNGHLRNNEVNQHPDRNEKFCSLCSKEVISECPTCKAPIRSYYYEQKAVYNTINSDPLQTEQRFSKEFGGYEKTQLSGELIVPAFCHNCGEPYPWTKTFLENAEDMVDMFDELSPEQKLQLKETFPDLIVETPKSKLAALQASKLINGFQSAGKDIFISMLKEKVIDSLFLLMHLN